MQLFRSLIAWIDRYWERRSYGGVGSFTYQLVIMLPLFIALGLMALAEQFGAEPLGPISVTILVFGSAGMFLMMGLWGYRWMTGYGRSAFQVRAAKEHRAKMAEKRKRLRSQRRL